MCHRSRKRAAAFSVARVLGVSILLLSGPAGNARGQRLFSEFSYQVAWPLGSTSDFSDKFSWHGAGFDLRRFINDRLAVGLTLGWNEFMAAHHSLNLFPVLLTLSAHAGEPRQPRLFIGGSTGIYIIDERRDLDLGTVTETNVHFGLAAGAGFMVPLGSRITGVLQTRYHHALAAGNIPDQSYLTYGVGIAWTWDP